MHGLPETRPKEVDSVCVGDRSRIYRHVHFILTSPPTNKTQSGISDSQKNFISQLENFRKKANATPNSLAFQEILKKRDAQLANLGSIENWSGVVLGVQSMQEKGTISIDIGGRPFLQEFT